LPRARRPPTSRPFGGAEAITFRRRPFAGTDRCRERILISVSSLSSGAGKTF
jgi:hypothetical protein